MAKFNGTKGDDNLQGTRQNDTFHLAGGGNDIARGGHGDDTFILGDALTADDRLSGASGSDLLVLNGEYNTQLVLAAETITGIDTIRLGGLYDYNLKTDDVNVRAGDTLTVDASHLGPSGTFTFDGSAETDGRF